MSAASNYLSLGQQLNHLFKTRWEDFFIEQCFESRRYSYQEFLSLVFFQYTLLKKQGVQEGDRVVSLITNQASLLAFYLAVLWSKAILVPIDPNKGKDEIALIAQEAKGKWFVAEEKVSNEKYPYPANLKWEDYNPQFIERKNSDISDLFENISEDAVFLITFTSGSTGVPKGVLHSFKNLFLSAKAFQKRFKFDAGNRFYHNLPMSYMAGILNLFILPLISESSLVVSHPFSIQEITQFWKNPITHQVNTFWFIPTIVSLLLKLDRGSEGIEYSKQNKITACIGTAPLNLNLKARFEDKYAFPLYESYGLSETLFVSTSYPSQKGLNQGVGEPLEGVELGFASDQEILISVPWMFKGYFGIASQDSNNSFPSGDLGSLNELGQLSINARKKDLIIRGGVNLSPRRIEEFVSAYQIFSEQVVMGMEDMILGEKTVCFFVSQKDKASLNEILKKINQDLVNRVGRDFQVDQFEQLREIPKNSNAKVDKILLKRHWEDFKYVCKD